MRSSGILIHISSLPSKYGIGTLGKEAYNFIDFLQKSNQRYWQVLPVNPTSYGDSPYQSPSAFAGNPYFIDLDMLCSDGLLSEREIDNYYFGDDETTIDFERMFDNRYPLLRTAFSRFEINDDYTKFVDENKFWLDDYALYMAVKEQNYYKCWLYWDEDIRLRKQEAVNYYTNFLSKNIQFYIFIQYLFYKQWGQMKKYANDHGVQIIGDMPIYVALDSAEVWTCGKLFRLKEDNTPIEVAGCPPDVFSEKGQLWGNPIYDWDAMESDGYKWWIKRIKMSIKLYDRVRIDHFRGFESYYSIPYGMQDATVGEWKKGPGMKLFDAVKQSLGDVDIIAEDLGYLTSDVYKLLDACGYPGMRVLQFAFDPDEDNVYLPHNYIKNCIAYTGTHDNDTVVGWYENANDRERKFAEDYLFCEKPIDMPYSYIRAVMASVADTIIVPIQDYLRLNSTARMNKPSTLGGNWTFRVKKEMLSDVLANNIAELTHLYRRG